MDAISGNERDMVGLLNWSINKLRGLQAVAEMMIFPMVIGDTPEQALAILRHVPRFAPRRASDSLPPGAVGIIRFGSVRTVDDVLDGLESSPMSNWHWLEAAMLCRTDQHVPNKTRRLKTLFGELIVDIEMYAREAGLPMESSAGALEYSVFLFDVADKQLSGQRTVLVAIKGTADTSPAHSCQPWVLVSLMARLEERAKSPLLNCANFHAQELRDGWQLFHHSLFQESLSWFQAGDSYIVTRNLDRGGLDISY